MKTPQFILLVLQVIAMFLAIRDHKKPKKAEDARITLAALILGNLLLWWGGWFGGAR